MKEISKKERVKYKNHEVLVCNRNTYMSYDKAHTIDYSYDVLAQVINQKLYRIIRVINIKNLKFVNNMVMPFDRNDKVYSLDSEELVGLML